MPYQNNNNRIVPNETLNATLKPVASPTNQEIKYQPDLTEANKTAATADALAKIGQGVLDINFLLQRKAEDSIIEAEIATESQGKNKREWADVSKNITGMAKFNPYIKDAQRRFAAKDICAMAALKLASNPNILNGKWSQEQITKFREETDKELLTALKESGLNPHTYSDYLEDYYKRSEAVAEQYTIKNNEYTYNNSLTAMAHDTTLRMYDAISLNETNDPASKIGAMKSVIEDTIKQAEALGIPADDIGTKILAIHLSEFIMQNPDLVNSEELMGAIANIQVYGKDLNEIIPNYSYQMHQILKQAREAQYQDREFELRNKELTIKMNSMDANKELYSFYKNNPNATPEEWASQINQTIGKYGLEEVGIDFLKGGLGNAHTIGELMIQSSDPYVLQNLGAKAAIGELSETEVHDAMKNGILNWKDGMNFIGLINKEIKANATDVKSSYNQTSQLIKNPAYKNIGKNVLQAEQVKIDTALQDYNAGKISKEEFKAAMQDTQRRIVAIQKINTGKVNANLLINGTYLRSQRTPESTRDTASKAFKSLAFVRTSTGFASGNISDGGMPSSPREKGNHKGYDVLGKQVYNTHSDGVVESAGYINDLGNFIIIKYSNGSRVRMGHLATDTSKWQGKTILANQFIGYEGNTGSASHGYHTDFRFMNKAGILISVEQFLKDLR